MGLDFTKPAASPAPAEQNTATPAVQEETYPQYNIVADRQQMDQTLTGEGDGDDEQIKVDLSLVPENIQRVAFTVTIYDADVRRQNFGQVNNAFIRIVDESNGQEILRYDLGEDFSIETAAIFGELYKHNGEWKFNAIGSGYQGGLAALCANYGVEVED